MLNVAAGMWNEIATTQKMATERWARLAAMGPQEMADALEQEMEKIGLTGRMARIFATVAPLLMENEAISRWIQESDQPHLRAIFSDLTTIGEAIALADQEFNLTETERKELRRLLEREVSQNG